MTPAEIKTIIQQQLPIIIAEDANIRDFILRTVSEYYAPKQETESKFDQFTARVDRILAELQHDREEQRRKWDEQNQKWDENSLRLDNLIHENSRKWEENNQKWEEK